MCPGLFSRQEVGILTGASEKNIEYWEQRGLVIPHSRYKPAWLRGKPRVCYSWQELLEIKTLVRLRQEISLQRISRIVAYLRSVGFDEQLHNKMLLVVGNDVFWARKEEIGERVYQVLGLTGKHVAQYQLVYLGDFDDILNEVWNTAKTDDRIDYADFQRKAKVRPLKKVA